MSSPRKNDSKRTAKLALSTKEFLYSPIDLTPLLDAVVSASRTQDWSEVRALMGQGYSLLWKDHNSGKSALYMLIEQEKDLSKCVGLLKLVGEDYKPEGKAYQTIMIDVMSAAIKFDKAFNDNFVIKNQLAENIEVFNKWRYEIIPLASLVNLNWYDACEMKYYGSEKLYFVARDFQIYYAFPTFEGYLDASINYNKMDDQERIYYFSDRIAAMLRGFASRKYQEWHVEDYIEKITDLIEASTLSDAVKKKLLAETPNIAIAEFCSHGLQDYAFHKIESMIIDINLSKKKHPDLDIILGNAIIAAARAGRADLIWKLCEYAAKAKVDQSPRFIEKFSCAAGAALVNDNIALAKVIINMVPEFRVLPDDLTELRQWPQHKVEIMFNLLKDCDAFNDIALHSVLVHSILAANVGSQAWLAAMKNEYGLEMISDKGFNYLIHNPKAIKELLETGKTHVTFDFPREDMQAFNAARQAADQLYAQPSHGPISFFRVKKLAHQRPHDAIPAGNMHNYVDIRKEILCSLRGYIKSHHLTKNNIEHPEQLYQAINDSIGALSIYKKLKSHFRNNEHKFFEKCCKIFAVHGVDVRELEKMIKPKVVREIN